MRPQTSIVRETVNAPLKGTSNRRLARR